MKEFNSKTNKSSTTYYYWRRIYEQPEETTSKLEPSSFPNSSSPSTEQQADKLPTENILDRSIVNSNIISTLEEATLVDYEIEKRRIFLDIGQLNKYTEIKWNNENVLIEHIRKPQNFFFSLIRGIITKEVPEGVKYFTLDIPLRTNTEKFQFVRYVHLVEENNFRLFLLNQNEFWEGEPFFPRMVYEEDGEFTEKDIPKAYRLEALDAYYEAINSQEAPFKPKPTELLQIVFENPGITLKELQDKLNISINTINNHYKTIIDIAKKKFGVRFKKGKFVAKYWYEMGLAFPKIS